MFSQTEESDDGEYERIEAAVLETDRGRWFLQEFARRRRVEASGEILAAIARLESRGMGREREVAEARRDAARAAATLADTVRRLHGFALGVGDGDAEADAAVAPPEPAEGRLGRRLEALQALDGLDVSAKMKLFG